MSVAQKEIRLLLVDDSSLVRQGIRAVLERHKSPCPIVVVGEAASVHETLVAAEKLQPDIILLDLRLPDGFGFTACRELIRRRPELRILILTSYMDDQYIYEAITAGAHGYLLKEIDPAGLVDAIQRVAAGESIISPDLTQKVMAMLRQSANQGSANQFTSLSPQEKRVLELVVQGKTNKEIGAKLSLAENTVKNYLASVFEKLHVKRRAQATALYLQSQPKPTRPN